MMRALTLLTAVLTLVPGMTAAQELPKLAFPVACTPGEDCWIANYPDANPTDRAEDFTCGARTYDGHTGTDFALRDFRSMQDGVFVLAATSGTVERVRDGEEDRMRSDEELASITDRECGNGVMVRHASGLRVLYCHLRENSISVKPGDRVVPLQPIAQVGQSGKAEFPHLHIELIGEDGRIDPFTGQAPGTGCDVGGQSLWEKDPGYSSGAIYADGFTPGAPDFEALKRDSRSPESLPQSTPALVYWFAWLGAQKGDRIEMRIVAPDGSVFNERTVTQDRTRAQQFYFAGRRLSAPLPPGIYRGSATIYRDDIEVLQRESQIVVR